MNGSLIFLYFVSLSISFYLVTNTFPRRLVENLGQFYVFSSAMYVVPLILDYLIMSSTFFGEDAFIAYLTYATVSILMFGLGFSFHTNLVKININYAKIHRIKKTKIFLISSLAAIFSILFYFRLSSIEFDLVYFIMSYGSERQFEYNIKPMQQ